MILYIDFDEKNDPSAAIYALYSALRAYRDEKAKERTEEAALFVELEASMLLEDIKEQLPEEYEECELEYEHFNSSLT